MTASLLYALALAEPTPAALPAPALDTPAPGAEVPAKTLAAPAAPTPPRPRVSESTLSVHYVGGLWLGGFGVVPTMGVSASAQDRLGRLGIDLLLVDYSGPVGAQSGQAAALTKVGLMVHSSRSTVSGVYLGGRAGRGGIEVATEAGTLDGLGLEFDGVAGAQVALGGSRLAVEVDLTAPLYRLWDPQGEPHGAYSRGCVRLGYTQRLSDDGLLGRFEHLAQLRKATTEP